VLEGPLSGDDHVVASCRRLIAADRLDWRKHHDPADWALVKEFADVVHGEVPFSEYAAGRRAEIKGWAKFEVAEINASV